MKRERGVALITAILVVAIATIASAMLLSAGNAAIHRTALLQDSEQASWVALGVESWVLSLLQRDEARNVDHFGEEWALPVDYLPVDHGHAQGGLIDLQGAFNLNNLAAPNPQPYIDQFRRLLRQLEAVPIGGEDITDAVLDWIDGDDEARFPMGAEDMIYLNLTPPYRSANRRFTSVSELLAVRGVTREVYAALTASPACAIADRPYPCLTALPQPTSVNLNTAPEPVLRALSERVDEARLRSFLEARLNDQPAENAATAAQDAGLLDAEPTSVAVNTRFFQLRAAVFIGSGRAALYSFIFRPEQGAPVVLGHSSEP